MSAWYQRIVEECGPDSDRAHTHAAFAALLFGLRDDPGLLPEARTLLETALDRGSDPPGAVALLAFSVIAVAGDREALALWAKLRSAPRPIWVHAVLAARLDVGAPRESIGDPDKIAAGLMLSRMLQPNFSGWQSTYFERRFGVERGNGLNAVKSPHALHDLELRRMAFYRFKAEVGAEFLEAVTAAAIDENISEADRRAALFYIHTLDRFEPAVSAAAVDVAERAVHPHVRIAALTVLNVRGATDRLRERLRTLARRETDPTVLPRIVEAMRHTDTGAGRLFVDLFHRFDRRDLRLEVGLLAVSKSESVNAAEVEAVLKHVIDRSDAELLVAIAPRLAQRGYLGAPASIVLAAFRVALLAAEQNEAEALLDVLSEHGAPSFLPIVRELRSRGGKDGLESPIERALDRLAIDPAARSAPK